VLVGLSGGLDSMALLDLLQRAAPRCRVRLAALHVNHQLSPNAGSWEAFCRRACRDRAIPLRCVRVDIPGGSGLEAGARSARYAALLSQPVEFVALAHHQDDQCETVLLQLLRGAGVRGLAGMPGIRKDEDLGHPSILRPLLDVPRSEIERYARRRHLEWIEDESNRDTRFARNFLRHELLPVLARRLPSYRATLARSARHLAEAARLLDELAEIDAHGVLREGALAAGGLGDLPPARARNLLRWFLARHGAAMPNAERLNEVLRQIADARNDAKIRVEIAGHELYCWKGGIHLVPGRPPAVPLAREWRHERRLALPELGGTLVFARGRGAGISLKRLDAATVTLRSRVGGERLRPDCRRPRRTVKNLLQEREVPPWLRARIPLLYCGEELVWVAGLGTDCAWQARPQEPSLHPRWLPGGSGAPAWNMS
jgi:tRNA(Ile)-lysidine synthase